MEEHLCCHLSELLITFIVLAEIAKPEELDAVVISLRSSDFQGLVSHSIKYFYRLHNRKFSISTFHCQSMYAGFSELLCYIAEYPITISFWIFLLLILCIIDL